MNIFFLHPCHVISTNLYYDVHVNKITVELMQMLANCYTPELLKLAPRTLMGRVRSHSYLHHPMSKWVMDNPANHELALTYLNDLIIEREYRWPGKKPIFASVEFYEFCASTEPLNLTNPNNQEANNQEGNPDNQEGTPFPLCMPDRYKTDDPYKSYQQYYLRGKDYLAQYTFPDGTILTGEAALNHLRKNLYNID